MWIPVTERLPEFEINVLTTFELTSFEVPTGVYSEPEINFVFKRPSFERRKEKILWTGHVDYWQPLPAPPNEHTKN